MTEEALLEECLSMFPTVFRKALEDKPKIRSRFVNKVQREYIELPVYRALCYEDSIIDRDFLSHNELASLGIRNGNMNALDWYSVSVNEDKEQLINCLDIPSEEKQIRGIAKGLMKCEYGPADFVNNKTHHNWYLYDGVIPSLVEQFKIEQIEVKKSDENDERIGILE